MECSKLFYWNSQYFFFLQKIKKKSTISFQYYFITSLGLQFDILTYTVSSLKQSLFFVNHHSVLGVYHPPKVLLQMYFSFVSDVFVYDLYGTKDQGKIIVLSSLRLSCTSEGSHTALFLIFSSFL